MGFRRDGDAALRRKRWKQAQNDLQASAGLSSAVTETEEDWRDYLNHEINVPGYDYGHSYPLSPQQAALKQLLSSWPGRSETMLGKAFLALERRNEGNK